MATIKISHDLNTITANEIYEFFRYNNTNINISSINNKIGEKISYNVSINNDVDDLRKLTIKIDLSMKDNAKSIIKNMKYVASTYYEFTKIQLFRIRNSYNINDLFYFKFNFNKNYIDRATDIKSIFNNFEYDSLFFDNILIFSKFNDNYELLETLCLYIMLNDNEKKKNNIKNKLKEKLDYYGYNEDDICKKVSTDIGKKAYLLKNTLNEVLKNLYYNEELSCSVLNDTLGIIYDYAKFLS